MERLRFDNHSKKLIATLVERHDSELALSDRSVRRNLSRYGEEVLRLLLQVKRADNLAQAPEFRDRQELISQWETMLNMEILSGNCFSLKQLAVKGNDLLTLGITGKAVGTALETLLELVIDEKLPNDKATLLNYAKEKLL